MFRRAGSKPDPKAIWYGRIDTPEQAADVLHQTAKAFLALAALQALLAIWLGPIIIVDAVINAALALLLMKYRSRVVACLLLGFALLTAVVTGVNRFSAEPSGPQNVVLALMLLWFGIRATIAAFRYHALASSGTAGVAVQ